MRKELLSQNLQNKILTLFPLKGNFRIAEIRATHASRQEDSLFHLKNLVCSSEPMYPRIDRWFEEKVIPGLKCSERVAYVAYENDVPVASSILKQGVNSKICHLKILHGFQDLHLGQMFFTKMLAETYNTANEIHFTLPESLWTERSGFFASFGFPTASKAPRQYRNGDQELICSSSMSVAWSAALEKLSGLLNRFFIGERDSDDGLLLSMKPQFAQRIFDGRKTVEVRKKISTTCIGETAVIYASRPTCAVLGEARIHSITKGAPSEIWDLFGKDLGCSKTEYDSYTASCRHVSALKLCDVHAYSASLARTRMSRLVGQDLIPPQSYQRINHHDGRWGQALSIATLLNMRGIKEVEPSKKD
jgi:predicted transcriptional regulator